MPTEMVPRGAPTLAIAFLYVGGGPPDEDDQRRAILAWAQREGVTVADFRVARGEAPDGKAFMAALDALPTARAGWLAVATPERIHPDASNMLGIFEHMANERGARVAYADGSNTPEPGQRCPICQDPVHPWPRYPRLLCGLCMREAADEQGRPLRFFNIDATGGFRAEYADTGEPRQGHTCYVRGVRCHADEARFGGIVIQPA